jgi:4-hydroxysphinganine ceramide fatty acyl 2-hydroxylase
MLNPGKNIRLFKSPILEQFTYVHPILPALVWLPVVAYCLATGLDSLSAMTSVQLVIAGMFIWTLAEYSLHRWLFHYEGESAFEKRMGFLLHGIHHDDPADARRLLMPPVAAITLAAGFWFLFSLVLGDVVVRPFFAGFILGYLWYDYTHFAVHHWACKSGRMKKLKYHHMQHHFATPDKRYGVSNLFWDKVFGSNPKK